MPKNPAQREGGGTDLEELQLLLVAPEKGVREDLGNGRAGSRITTDHPFNQIPLNHVVWSGGKSKLGPALPGGSSRPKEVSVT